MNNCICTSAGHCTVYDKYQSDYQILICQEKVYTPEECEIVKKTWLSLVPCKYRKDQVSERIQKVKSKTCNTCNPKGSIIPVYVCELHGLCTFKPWQIGQKEKVCSNCKDYVR